PLSFEAAVARTLQGNPKLKGTAYRQRAADARIGQARLRPAPELSLDVEDVLGTGVAQGFSGSQTTIAISQVLELGAQRERRVASATAARELASTEARAEALDVIAEMTRRYVEVAAAQERLALRERAVLLARRTTAGVQQRVDAARAPDVELHRARIAQSRSELARENAEHELLSARHLLSAQWGAVQPDFGRVTEDLYRMPEADDFEVLVQRLRTHPDFLRFVSGARLRDAEVRLAESRRHAGIKVGAGVRRLQASQDEAFVASIAVPLFGGSRAAAGVAEAEAQRDLVGVEEQAAFVRTRAQLFELYQELRHARNETALLRDQVKPGLETVAKEAEYAYERGRYSYLEWTAAQAELIDVEAALIEAAANAHRHLAEIERLTGEPLAAPQN
ncbi:MAG TPA: TolC family protein, partial [Nevskiaceae bacterium]|nr:TolC family protein [Nevskiaceae bacterium]